MLLHAAFMGNFTHARAWLQGTTAYRPRVEPRPATHLNYFDVLLILVIQFILYIDISMNIIKDNDYVLESQHQNNIRNYLKSGT